MPVTRLKNCPRCHNLALMTKEDAGQCFSCGLSQKMRRPKANASDSEIYAINSIAQSVFVDLLHKKEGTRGIRYFKGRGLSDDTIKNFGLGYAGSGKEVADALSAHFTRDELVRSGLFKTNDDGSGSLWCMLSWRVTYPIMDEYGRVVAFGGRVLDDRQPKYKNSPETEIFSKRERLYAWDKAVQSGRNFLILCEGYMDVISMHQAGITNVVASLGTSLTDAQAHLMKSYADYAVILYDTDAAGQTATDRAIDVLRAAGITVFVANSLPCKDPDEYLKKHGAEGMKEKICHPMTDNSYQAIKAAKDKNMQKLISILLQCTEKEQGKIVRFISAQ